MALDTVSDFVDSLRHVRLLEPEQQNVLASDLLPRFAEPKALAGELIRRGWLTPYQANLLLQGRGGELTLGSYVLLERIGEGGMGQVFKAKNWKLGRIVAVKLIRKERLANEEAVRRFHREIRAAAQLSHPNIVLAYDADEVNGTHFFAMEFVEGSDLAKLIKQHGPMPVAQACDCVRQAAVGLLHAHERGMVHRDIKPHNLLLTKQGVVKILDMGLARLTHADEDGEASTTMTQEGVVMGTPDYMAPEQAEESHSVDVRADLYSLGCTLYQLLTGKVPFPGGTLIQKLKKHQFEQPMPVEQRRPDVPPAVAAVVRKLMAKRPQDRYQTPAELVRALETLPGEDSRTLPSGVQAGQAIVPTHDTINEALDFRPTDEAAQAMMAEQRSWRQTEKRKLLLAAVGGGVMLLGLAVALWLLVGRSGRPLPEAQPVAREQPSPPKKVVIPFDQWLQEVSDLPAEEQIRAVVMELKRRNPGFDGKVTHKIHRGEITVLEFCTDEVTDIAPVRALPGLKRLACPGTPNGKGKLADLGPLKGLRLASFDCTHTQVADLRSLEGMSLDELSFHGTEVADLSPLKGMALNGYLGLSGTLVSDLSPLKGMPLRYLNCNFPRRPITDLRPLQGMPLEGLLYRGVQVSDISPLRGMSLKVVECDFKPERDAEILRSIKTLEKINDKPVAEFWKDVGDPPKP